MLTGLSEIRRLPKQEGFVDDPHGSGRSDGVDSDRMQQAAR
jgi:hypothetical protein